MPYNVRLGGRQFALLLVALASLSGCGRSRDSAKSPDGNPSDAAAKAETKPYVKVLLGQENYQKSASRFAKGKKEKFKGELSVAGSKGKVVAMSLSEVYTGDKPAVQAADLTRDFMKDRSAALKKYNPMEKFAPEIIVEGVIAELVPERYTVLLAGHEE